MAPARRSMAAGTLVAREGVREMTAIYMVFMRFWLL